MFFHYSSSVTTFFGFLAALIAFFSAKSASLYFSFFSSILTNWFYILFSKAALPADSMRVFLTI